MGLKFNGRSIPQSAQVRFGGIDCARVLFNGAEVWRRQKIVYPGTAVAAVKNTGYAPYFTCAEENGVLTVEAFGGTEQGAGYALVGPFSSIGFSRLFFSTLRMEVQNPFSHAIAALADETGAELLRLAAKATGEDSGYDRTFTQADEFSIAERSDWYFKLDVAAGATRRGLVSRLTLSGLILE